MIDPRPVLFCHECCCDVVTLPNGSCPWCDRRLVERSHSQVLALHAQRVLPAA